MDDKKLVDMINELHDEIVDLLEALDEEYTKQKTAVITSDSSD